MGRHSRAGTPFPSKAIPQTRNRLLRRNKVGRKKKLSSRRVRAPFPKLAASTSRSQSSRARAPRLWAYFPCSVPTGKACRPARTGLIPSASRVRRVRFLKKRARPSTRSQRSAFTSKKLYAHNPCLAPSKRTPSNLTCELSAL